MRAITHSPSRAALWLAATGTLALACGMAGCADAGSDPATAPSAVSSSPAAVVTVRDPWVKAVDDGNSTTFATLVNNSDHDVTVVSATSPAATKVELHETAMADGVMKMQPKQGGFVISAHGEHELAPGGDHLMLMGVTGPIKPGDEITVTLTLSNGETVAFTALAKPFAAGNETYVPASPSAGAA